ncbi:MAG: Glutamate synthase [NADPH] large chain [uncultured Truepera sp.]|uniref:Glutamate synthase [NADPH] large chain n=1 Tax=uncultured Truepera sp. TaxID=543023 RepID=A0A6J4VTN1_9DEIN|nr:MAG: Glutamate synthase [NADPH] large chain [uncultured Truepera sp.]
MNTTLSDFTTLAWPRERDACGVGFVADTYGRRSHTVLKHALTALDNLSHRGAVSADGLTGDGAGVLTGVPHKLFRRDLAAQGVTLEHDTDLAVGVFFVSNAAQVEHLYRLADEVIAASKIKVLLWREVPMDTSALGEDAKARLPVMRQVLLGRPQGLDDNAFERLLYLTRKRLERRLMEAQLGTFYIPSFSHRTVSYKGLMVAPQLPSFYRDLADPDFETAIAVFHQRYSTNTMPRWSLAQPFRFLAHNGEINTLQGNVNFMRAREAVLESALWGEDIEELLPIIQPGGSDSAALDNAFELLTLSGRDPVQAIMMLVPEAYEELAEMEPDLRAFYEYHGTLMEPWDGPAALALTDGRYAVAAVDRNGLRPQRYWLSSDGLVVVGSEAGIVPLDESTVVEKGKLKPGSVLVVDTVAGRLLRNGEVKASVAAQRPYSEWLSSSMVRAPEQGAADELATRPWDEGTLRRTQKVFGYNAEDYDRILTPMALAGEVPVGSMGDDTPLAVLSEQPQSLFRYFKQRFAQVTNPPIDPLRERLVMSLETMLGPRGQLLEEDPGSARVVTFTSPVIDEAQFAWLKSQDWLNPYTLEARFAVSAGPEGLEGALTALCDEAVAAVKGGVGLLIISDRGVGLEWAPIPTLLATSAVHHSLIEAGLRTRTALSVESGEPREDHHIACLVGYGAAIVHPYLALASARDAAAAAKEPVAPEVATKNYLAALEKGILKIMSKMGISAVSSYRAAQIFEALGVSQEVIDRYFRGTPSRIGGAGLEAFATDVLGFHAEAFGEDPALKDRGLYRFRKAGEYHALNPLVFKALHKAVRTASFEAYGEYAKLVDERPACNLRDLLAYKKAETPLPLDEVEPVDAIVMRFTTQAMSHGSVSRETHETLAIAMNRLGAKSNSGEGGEDAGRFRPYERDMPELSHAPWHPKAGDWGNSAIKQVASGRFGVTPEYLVSASELEIKMAQGSKPGEGGQIPGHKVNEEIAAIRRSVPGVTLISPPPHHDIYSIEDLAQLIYDLKRVNKEARVGVKLVASAGVGTIAAGVVKGYADNIQISGFDGGTGASPLSSVKHSGVPWELGLAETQQVLLENNLRGRVTLRVDGGMKTGRDVIMGALLGAEEYGFGTSALVAAGCTMQRACHLNTCSVGIATQREDLRKKFPGQPEHVVNFLVYVAQQVRMILAEMGFRSLDEVVGRVDLLAAKAPPHAKAELDLSAVLRDADPSGSRARRAQGRRNDRPEEAPPLDETIYGDALQTIASGEPLSKRYAITNRERSVGARLAGEVARVYGDAGLPPATIHYHFSGVAGQAFGVFNISGVQLTLEGEAQDYVGKGMAGGEIVVRPAKDVPFTPAHNTIVGNTVLYGATGGSLFAAGRAGERLAVRNSGARVVVEGCGDHGCEYMTGGVTVVLGATGRNFGAGMSGGVAYVLDDGTFEGRYNSGMVDLERVTAQVDADLLKALVARHAALTGSARGAELLANWESVLERFWKVAPKRQGDVPVIGNGLLESLLQEVQGQPVVL